ncbi:hypothetical protein [Buttiauxella sp. A111]|uniref:hypothetical protein n=1 Tax=Buttiauxella sp. A111 TaxID=2563088 RepID=UPI001615DFD0|nr:hypothetical protein [Buttiauxella sp. A111]
MAKQYFNFFLRLISILIFIYAVICDLNNDFNFHLTIPLFVAIYIFFLLSRFSDDKPFLSTFSFWFITFFFLYGVIWPIFYFYFNFSFFSSYYDEFSNLYTLNSSLISFSLFVILFSFTLKETNAQYTVVSKNIDLRKLPLLYAYSTIIFSVVAITYYSNNLAIFALSGQDRIAIKDYVNVDFWYFLGSVSSASSIFVFTKLYSIKAVRKHFYIIMFLCSFYFLLDLSIGGRKFLIYFTIIVIYQLSRSNQLKPFKLLLILSPVVLAMASRGAMDKVAWGERSFIDFISGYAGEFIFTNITSAITVYSNFTSCNIYSTPINPYLSWVFYLVPRDVFLNKPYSVAMNFSSYMDVNMGFALTPLTESLCAFKYLGPYVFPLLFTGTFFIIYKLSKKWSFLYILLLSMVMDINRGEYSYFITSYLSMVLFWVLLERLTKIGGGDEK